MSGQLQVSTCAARRYIEQVKPMHTIEQARAEMHALAGIGRYVEAPTWAHARRFPTRAYLEVSDGIVFTVEPGAGVICTVLTRAQHATEVRASLSRAKRARREARRNGIQQIRGRKVARRLTALPRNEEKEKVNADG